MNAIALARLVLRPGRAGTSVPAALPVAVFALATLVSLSAASWLRFGASIPYGEMSAGTFRVFLAAEGALLIVPIGMLAASAARLSSRRRDDQLSALRLLGATSSTTAALALIESIVHALVGALIGAGAYAALLPVMAQVPSEGVAVGIAALALPVPLVAAIVLGAVVVAVASTASSLHSVTVSPLGVLARQQPKGVHWIRLVIAVGMLVAISVVSGMLGSGEGQMMFATLLIVLLGQSVMNVVGPFLLSIFAKIRLLTAWSPRRLLSARGVLENPSISWRPVSAVAATSLVALAVALGLGLIAQAETSTAGTPEAVWLADFRVGLIATLAAATLLAACSIIVAQVADVLDRSEVYRAFRLMGMPVPAMHRARGLSVRSASWTAVAGAAMVGAVILSSIPGVEEQVTEPLFVVPLVSTVLVNLLLVDIGLLVSRGTLARVISVDGGGSARQLRASVGP